jgi:O-antigen/teichoic acid export membrane protein
MRDKILDSGWGDYFLTAGSRLGVLAFSFAANVIITRTIGAEGRGLYALVNNSVILVMMVASIGVGEAVAYFVARAPDLRRETAGNGLLVVCAGSAVVVAAGAVLRAELARLLGGIPPAAVTVILLCVLPAGFARVFRAMLQGLRQFGAYNLCVVGRPLAILAYSALILLGLGKGMSYVPLMMLLVVLTECGINVVLALRRLRPLLRVSGERIRSILSYGLRANVTVLLHFVYLRIGIFLLGYLMSRRDVGIFSISASLAEIQIYIPLAVGWVWMPKVATQPLAESVSGTKRLVVRVLPLLAGTSALLAVFGRPLLSRVFGSEFTASYIPMLILLPGAVLLGIVLILSGFFDGSGKPHLSAVLSVCAFSIIVVTDILLIPIWGINGAALGSSLGYLGAFLVGVVLFVKAARRR